MKAVIHTCWCRVLQKLTFFSPKHTTDTFLHSGDPGMKTNCIASPVDGRWSGFQIVVAGWVHKGAESGAGGHKHKRTCGPAAQRLKAAIWVWSMGIQRSREVARGGVAVKRSRGRGGGGIVKSPLKEVHSGYPSRPPALFGVHVTEGDTQGRRGPMWREGLQFWEGCADPGSDYWSARLPALRRALPEQHHSTTALICNMI